MAKFAPVLFLLAAVIAAAVVLFGGGESDGPSLDTTDDWGEEETTAPELRTSDAAKTGRRKKRGDTTAEPAPTRPPPRGRAGFLKGVVVDDASGAPIRGAVLHAEYTESVCPRLPQELVVGARVGLGQPPAGNLPSMGQWGGRHGAAAAYGSLATGADGRFAWSVGDVRTLADRVDVFVRAAGYIGGVVCQPEMGSDLTVRLKKAIALEVEVTDEAGRPIEGARLMVRPAPDTPALPGHAGMGATDANGRGEVGGLAPGTPDGKGLV
ncbi:MAG: carboxypeptidase-like regulatory domain-containing protein, partial [Planctomycetota bacterium]|nr:carboxypeptidase-like regulatory domain-containing protein [Planctomycetota bacterium]